MSYSFPASPINSHPDTISLQNSRVSNVNVSLKQIVLNELLYPYGYSELHQFLEKEHCTENLEFLKAVLEYDVQYQASRMQPTADEHVSRSLSQKDKIGITPSRSRMLQGVIFKSNANLNPSSSPTATSILAATSHSSTATKDDAAPSPTMGRKRFATVSSQSTFHSAFEELLIMSPPPAPVSTTTNFSSAPSPPITRQSSQRNHGPLLRRKSETSETSTQPGHVIPSTSSNRKLPSILTAFSNMSLKSSAARDSVSNSVTCSPNTSMTAVPEESMFSLDATSPTSPTLTDSLTKQFHFIFDTFLNEDSEKQVNLPSHITRRLSDEIQQFQLLSLDSEKKILGDPFVFKDAFDHIASLLRQSVLQRFVQWAMNEPGGGVPAKRGGVESSLVSVAKSRLMVR